MAPAPPGATHHIHALNKHVEAYIQQHPQQMQALKSHALQVLGSGASHVRMDTSALFPTALCEAAWRELRKIRAQDGADGCHLSRQPRQIRLPAWAAWVDGLKAVLREELQLPGRGRGVRGELRDESQAKGTSWHTDFGDLSATTALKGPSTEFAPSVQDPPAQRIGDEDDRDKIPASAIETAPRGHTLLFLGNLVPNALVHRAPRSGAERLVFVG